MNNDAGSILAIFPYLVTGSLPVAVMRELRRRNVDVSVVRYLPVAAGYTMDPASDFAAEDRLFDLYQHLGPTGADILEEIVKAKACDTIVQVGSPWAYAHLARLKERMPSLRMIDMLYNSGPHFHSFASYAPIFDAVIVESAAMMAELGTKAGGARIRQVESGVDLHDFVPGDRQPNWNGDHFTLGYFGRLSPEKNPLGFIDTAEQIAAALPWVRFVIFGQGPQQAEVEDRLARSPSAAVIRFGGFVDHPTQAYGAMDALVVPSILDGRPASVMEASACGVPVLGAPIGGIPELIEDGRNGHLVGHSDAARLVEILESWAAEPDIFLRVRSSARAVAEARFDRRRMMDAYHRAFSEVLASQPKPIGFLDA